MTREEWLTRAVELIDTEVFNGDLDTINHKFQINCGICPGKKLSTTIQPYDGEDVKLEDFFPTTISVNHQIKDPIEILGVLARECVFAFFNESKLNKRSKKLFEKYLFGQPYTSYNPSDDLDDKIHYVYEQMIENYGEFPGVPVVVYKKKNENQKKNTLTVFCDSCGYEMKVSRKMHEKHGQGLPTCPCGAKMGIDYGEDEVEEG